MALTRARKASGIYHTWPAGPARSLRSKNACDCGTLPAVDGFTDWLWLRECPQLLSMSPRYFARRARYWPGRSRLSPLLAERPAVIVASTRPHYQASNAG